MTQAGQSRSESTLTISGLNKFFDNFQAVDDLSMTVDANEIVCLLGPSGCGKTTTLRMIAGLESVSSGDIWLGGKRIDPLPPQKRNIAMAFQFYGLYPNLTVGENLLSPLAAENLSKAARQTRLDTTLKRLGLTALRDSYPSMLSEGDKQRTAVGRCIIRTAEAFLFDEPLSRLDANIRVSLRSEIKSLLVSLQRPTVIVTHDQEEAVAMGDRIAVMQDGKLAQIGTPLEVFNAPNSRFVAEFIGTPSLNVLDGQMHYENGTKMFSTQAHAIDIGGQGIGGHHAGLNGQIVGEGASIGLGIRPRAIQLATTPMAMADLVVLPGKIQLSEPLGPETLYHLDTPLGALRAVSVTTYSDGTAVHVGLPRHHFMFFGADGMALKAEG